MRTFSLIALLVLLLGGCAPQHIDHGPAAPVDQFQRPDVLAKLIGKQVAVLPFECANRTAGWQYAEEFSLFLGRLGKFTIIERLQIESLLKEQNLDSSRMDDATAVKIGKMLGASAVVLGSASTDYVNVRLVDTETSAHAWNARIVAQNNDPTNAMLRRDIAVSLVSQLSGTSIGIFALPAKNIAAKDRAAFGITQTSGAVVVDFSPMSNGPAAGLKEGDVIVQSAGRMVNTPIDLIISLLDKKIGDSVPLSIIRRGQRLGLSVQTIKRAE